LTEATCFISLIIFFTEKHIPPPIILACGIDGAPSIGHRGFTTSLKNAIPGVVTVHYAIHRQLLVAKKKLRGRLQKSMGTVIAAVYKIKAHALISRVFRQLYIDID